MGKMDQILVKEEVEGDVLDGMLTEDIPQSGFNAPNHVYPEDYPESTDKVEEVTDENPEDKPQSESYIK